MPWFAFIHSALLSLISWGTLSIYIKIGTEIPRGALEQMFIYITLIIAWLVTTRPVYALEVHDKITMLLFDIMQDLKETKNINDTSWENVFIYIVTNVSSHPKTHSCAENIPNVENKGYKKNLKAFQIFKMKQRLALPAAMHGLCVMLIFLFHITFLPILLYSHDVNVLSTILCNYILGIYTTGCLQVAISLENPYTDVTIRNSNPAVKEFQVLYSSIVYGDGSGSSGSGPSGSGPSGSKGHDRNKTVKKNDERASHRSDSLFAILYDSYEFIIYENWFTKPAIIEKDEFSEIHQPPSILFNMKSF
jgi:hypothetical protein